MEGPRSGRRAQRLGVCGVRDCRSLPRLKQDVWVGEGGTAESEVRWERQERRSERL